MARKRKVDRPLRRDVRSLGEILGEVLIEREGRGLFELEEEIRLLSIRRRRGPREGRGEAEAKLQSILGDLSTDEAGRIVRAFSSYFQLVNLAEQHHRIRRMRAHAMEEDTPPQRGSVEASLMEAKAAGIPAARVRATLASMQVILTFTAHPTQATRRTILEKIYRIARELERRDRYEMTPLEAAASAATIREQVGILWQTNELRRARPSVADEVKNILWYVENVLWDVVTELPEVIAAAFERVYGEPLGETVSPIRIHSWAGGDMDGNPLVTPEVVEDTIRVHRSRALALLLEGVEELGRELSHSTRYTPAPKELLASLEADREAMPHVAMRAAATAAGEPWREKLRFIEARLRATLAVVESRRARAADTPRTPVPLASTGLAPRPTASGFTDLPPLYQGAKGLLRDLEILERSLEEAGAERGGARQVRLLIERVRTFGLDIAELELRVLAKDALDASAWIAGEGGRTAGAERFLSSLRRIADLGEEAGHGCQTLILSMASTKEEILAALQCARASGLWDAERGCAAVDVVPLFETGAALLDGPKVLAALFEDPGYRHHVLCRGHQEVMVGYSDSAKEEGLLAANQGLRTIQSQLVALSAKTGIPIRIFHGRGESVARGGGPAQQAILALPAGSIACRYKATEQGEALDHKYARPELARRTLELILGGVLLHSLGAQARPTPAEEARYDEAFETLARTGRDAYRELVWEDPSFAPFFHAATPIDQISLLPIGSRPAKRATGGLESLRAIPWVFAWTQTRAILPGWYGVGSAFEAFAKEEGGEELLLEMAARWPSFQAVLQNVEMVLAKTDLGIARRYASLAEPALRQAIWPRIEAEHRRTRRWIRRLLGTKRLLDDNPPLQRSITLRNPYVDPMSFLQVELLRRVREGADEGARALLLTLSGIAAGMRSTG